MTQYKRTATEVEPLDYEEEDWIKFTFTLLPGESITGCTVTPEVYGGAADATPAAIFPVPRVLPNAGESTVLQKVKAKAQTTTYLIRAVATITGGSNRVATAAIYLPVIRLGSN